MTLGELRSLIDEMDLSAITCVAAELAFVSEVPYFTMQIVDDIDAQTSIGKGPCARARREDVFKGRGRPERDPAQQCVAGLYVLYVFVI